MGTWINGAGVNREAKKEQPRTVPSTIGVQETIRRAIQQEQEAKELKRAAGFLEKFVSLFAGYSIRTNLSHLRRPAARSTRSADEIVGELKSFYTRRPRPWRYYGNRAKRA